MTLIGIDFGSKRVGVAVTDDGEQMAFPHAVLPNDEKLVPTLAAFAKERGARGFVMGESRDYKGENNRIMELATPFAAALTDACSLPVFLEPELLTSAQAAHIQGENKMLDASAAAIILGSYLEKKH